MQAPDLTLKTRANILLSLIIIVLALPVAALADLRVAIDDGSPDAELYVYLDEHPAQLPVGENRQVFGSAAPSLLPLACESQFGDYSLRQSVAITSQFDFFMNRGVTIISEDTIDSETRKQIRTLLSAAGHDDDIVFVGPSSEADPVARTASHESKNPSL